MTRRLPLLLTFVLAGCGEPELPPDVLVPGPGARLVSHLDLARLDGASAPSAAAPSAAAPSAAAPSAAAPSAAGDPAPGQAAPGEAAAGPDPAGVARAFMGRDLRDAIYLRGAHRLLFRVRPSAGSSFRFGAGVPRGSPPVTFGVAVSSTRGRQEVDRLTVGPAATWLDRRIDLSPWAGKTVTLELFHPEPPEGQVEDLVAYWGTPRLASPSPETVNVIVYLIDTLRADHLGTYGYPRATSPTIDAWAAGGAVFERCYSQDTRTLGSVSSLLTSLYPPTHGIDKYGKKIGASVTTLAETFRDAGYETGSFITNVNAGTLPGLDRGFNHLNNSGKHYTDRKALRTLPKAFFDWLDEHGDEPFFAYIHTAEPHRPYIPPRRFDVFSPDYRGRTNGYFDGEHGFRNARTPEDISRVEALYDGEILLADHGFGKLLASLGERGLRERTVVLVTSDHGEELRDHGDWNHGQSLYNELLRVPLIAVGPGLPAGLRVSEPVQSIDIAPTVLALAGITAPAGFEGTSLLPLVRHQGVQRYARREVFAMATQHPRKMGVVRDRWKCIFAAGGDLELYDLEADPGERSNVAAETPDVASAMFARIRTWLEERQDQGTEARLHEISDEDLERLRALGYIE